MYRRALVTLFIIGTTATLAAQTNPSFELHGDTYQVSNGYYTLPVAGDFNNDGKPDLVQCCSNTGLVFRAGNGDGTFQAPAAASDTPVTTSSLVAADVNGDGNLDLVAVASINPPPPPASGNYSLVVWLGNGDGTFQAPQIYASTQGPSLAVVGNFFSDGHPDIAVGGYSGDIDLFRNEGDGTFTLAKSVPLANSTGSQIQLVAGDLNGSGVSDLAAIVGPESYVLWNDGHGNLSQQELGTYAYAQLAISRLNGAGMMDILIGYECSPPSGLPNYCVGFDAYYGQGNSKLLKKTLVTFFPSTPSEQTSPSNFKQIAGVDVNGDGYGDIVVFGADMNCTPDNCLAPTGSLVWLGNADGSFQQTPQQFMALTAGMLGTVAMADFNRDGLMDFAEPNVGADGYTQFFINSTQRTSCGTYTVNPSVTVCQPVDNAYSPSPVRVEATTHDTSGVTALQQYVDNELVYSKDVSSFNITLPESLGSHLFVTKGWSHGVSFFSSDRNVTVYNGTPGVVCPAALDTASICLPAGATSDLPVMILANGNTGASPPNAAQLYIDNKLVVNNHGSCYQKSCTVGWSYVQTTQSLSAGTHDLVFKVWDAAGNIYSAQKTVTVD
jgi:hypothetical protein